jgi:hypothetical protein
MRSLEQFDFKVLIPSDPREGIGLKEAAARAGGWALHRLGDRLRIAEVVLLSSAVRPHVFGRHRPGIVAQ